MFNNSNNLMNAQNNGLSNVSSLPLQQQPMMMQQQQPMMMQQQQPMMMQQQPMMMQQQQPMMMQQQPMMMQQQPMMMQQQQPMMMMQPMTLQQQAQPVLISQQPTMMMQQQQPILMQQQQPILMQQQQPVMMAGNGKAKHGHHHGVRNHRSEAVIPTAVLPLVQQQPIMVQPVMQQQQPIMREMPTQGLVQHETLVRPAQIVETIRTDTVMEIQPVIHREIDQTTIHHVEKHITEAAAANRGGVVQMAPIVQETIVRREIDEVQPVIHRQVANTLVVREEQHLSERVLAPTQHTKEVVFENRQGLNQSAPIIANNAPLAPAPVLNRGLSQNGLNQQQGLGLNQGMNNMNINQTAIAPEIHETRAMPAIVDERVRVDKVVEVQPVIHREIDQTTVHHVEQHITEAAAPNRGGVVQMAPIVQETVRPHVIDEITPVVHREVAQTVVERVEEHHGERIVAPTQHTNSVVVENNLVQPTLLAGQQQSSIGAPVIGMPLNGNAQAHKPSLLEKGRGIFHKNGQNNTSANNMGTTTTTTTTNQQAF